jgi:hypothetical protein
MINLIIDLILAVGLGLAAEVLMLVGLLPVAWALSK